MIFPCMFVVSIVIVGVGSILICVCTMILVFSVVCELASIWNVVIQVTGYRNFQWWALVCYLCKPGVDLLICLGYVVFEGNCVPISLAILVAGHQGWCYKRIHINIMSCVDHEQGVCCQSWPVVQNCVHHE